MDFTAHYSDRARECSVGSSHSPWRPGCGPTRSVTEVGAGVDTSSLQLAAHAEPCCPTGRRGGRQEHAPGRERPGSSFAGFLKVGVQGRSPQNSHRLSRCAPQGRVLTEWWERGGVVSPGSWSWCCPRGSAALLGLEPKCLDAISREGVWPRRLRPEVRAWAESPQLEDWPPHILPRVCAWGPCARNSVAHSGWAW